MQPGDCFFPAVGAPGTDVGMGVWAGQLGERFSIGLRRLSCCFPRSRRLSPTSRTRFNAVAAPLVLEHVEALGPVVRGARRPPQHGRSGGCHGTRAYWTSTVDPTFGTTPSFMLHISGFKKRVFDVQLAETVWKPGTRPALDAAYESAWTDGNDPYVPERRWAAYLRKESPQIVLSTRFREADEGFPRLESYLDRRTPSSLLDHLFVVDTYHQSRALGTPLPTERDLDFTPDPVVDELLSTSDGILLWQFQFEQLAQLFVDRRSDAIALRRRINQKRPEAWARIEEMTFSSGQSFRNVVEERMLYEGVVSGQWGSAKLLFDE